MATGQYSFEALIRFMEWMIEKGLVNRETGGSWKTAAQKVLSSLDPSETEDLRALDRDAAFTRFQNLNRSTYTPNSLKVYRGRFTSALDNFLAHANDPSAFKPSVTSKAVTVGKKASAISPKKKKISDPEKRQGQSQVEQPAMHSSLDSNLTLPIPLRPGLLVKIFGLPADLTEQEAKKICAVVSAYVTQK